MKSYVVIGVRFTDNDLFRKIETSIHRNCGVVGSGPYCSTCGKRVEEVRTEETPVIPNFEAGDEELLGFDVVCVDDDYLVGKLASDLDPDAEGWKSPDLCKRLPPEAVEKIREKLQEKLEPRGLWRENFGIWHYLYMGG